MLEKLDKTVRKETLYIAIWVGILSLLMEAIFLIIGKWSLSVLLGNIWSAAVGISNFLILGIGVQIAVTKKDENEAKKIIKISHTFRSLGLVVLSILGAYLFDLWAVIIPLLFPRIAVFFRPKFGGED